MNHSWSEILTICLICSIVHFLRLTYMYRESPISELNVQMPRGPYARLFTTSSRAQYLDVLERDLKTIPGEPKSIAFLMDPFVAGYLYSSLTPKCFLLYFQDYMSAPGGYFKHVLDRFYARIENWPDVAFVKPYDLPVTDFITKNPEFRPVRTDNNAYYRIYRRVRSIGEKEGSSPDAVKF